MCTSSGAAIRAVTSRYGDYPPSIAAANDRILKALEQPIPLQFPNGTPLDDLAKYLEQATTTPSYHGIPVYLDPLGLQEAECSLSSTFTIDLEGVPLTTSLGFALEQIGLTYFVKDGALVITSDETENPPFYPFAIVGHCVFALISAAIGGVVAPLVSDARRERPGSGGTADASAIGRASEDQTGRSAGAK